MGQLRQVHCPVGAKRRITLRGKMLLPLLLGFTVSATLVFAGLHLVGVGVNAVGVPVAAWFVVGPVLCLAAVCDLVFPRIRVTLFRRQTPRRLAGVLPLPLTGLVWGLDTGSVFSTFRSSAATWAAAAVAVAGWGPWWSGVSYAAGFCVPIALLVLSFRVVAADEPAPAWRSFSTELLVGRLGSLMPYVRLATAGLAATAAALAFIGS